MNKLLIILPILFLFFSCDSWIDVKPENQVTYTNYFETEKDVEGAALQMLAAECAVRVEDGKGCAVLGARPAKAARVELPAELAEKLAAGKASAEELKAAASEISDQFTTTR